MSSVLVLTFINKVFRKTLTAWLQDQARRHDDKSKTVVTDESIAHTSGKYTYRPICVNAFPSRAMEGRKRFKNAFVDAELSMRFC